MSTKLVLCGLGEMKPRLFRGALRAAFVVAIAAMPAAAQTGGISGRVTEKVSGEPLTGASVTAVRSGGGGSASAKSVADGAYRLTNLPAGMYTVSVTARIGLAPRTVDSVVVRSGETTTLVLAMSPIARQLEQVVTTATGGDPRLS